MRVLVCGGRDYTNVKLIERYLDIALEKIDGFELIHGRAPSGADDIADYWGLKRKVTTRRFPADWNQYGKAAGPIRNQTMLDHAKPDIVIAFPGDVGTANMIDISMKARTPVYCVTDHTYKFNFDNDESEERFTRWIENIVAGKPCAMI